MVSSIPVADYVSAVSVGIVDGRLLLDLDYAEDSSAEVDMNFVMTGKGLFIEVQGTAETKPFDRDRLTAMTELAAAGIGELTRRQREILGGLALKTIVFASRNRGKVQEIQAMMADVGVTLRSLEDYPDLPEIVEDGTSFLENALKKARTVAEFTGEIALADDSGLEVAALDGAPGIYSSRYAGEGADDAKNIRKLLNDLRGVPPAERGAVFRCVLVLYRPDGRYRSL